MRPKFVIAVLVVAGGLLALIVLASKPFRSTPSTNVAEKTNSPPPVARIEAAPVPVAPTPAPVAVVPATNHAEYVHKRIAELNALAMNNDSASLETILSELRNPDRQIRKGALQATMQFEDRAAIPRLKEIAAETDDEDEKADLLAAADWLNLPSLSEYTAQQQAEQEALGITNPPVSRTNHIRSHRGFAPGQQLQSVPSGGPVQSGP